jgi:hypothetical protein
VYLCKSVIAKCLVSYARGAVVLMLLCSRGSPSVYAKGVMLEGQCVYLSCAECCYARGAVLLSYARGAVLLSYARGAVLLLVLC